MQSINFKDGLKRLAINGDENRVIVVNPTDVGIVARYREKLPDIETISENSAESPDVLDKKIREFIDYIIGSQVSEIVFGKTNCLSMSGGQTIFENFLTAYMEYMKPEIKAEYELSKKRVEKYTKQISS
ncbi:MAG: hypothetical protein NC177_15575 [Ruminococcus flavefaciens]|nr:hypothetical protein [Ruminococcus flavefaciens]